MKPNRYPPSLVARAYRELVDAGLIGPELGARLGAIASPPRRDPESVTSSSSRCEDPVCSLEHDAGGRHRGAAAHV